VSYPAGIPHHLQLGMQASVPGDQTTMPVTSRGTPQTLSSHDTCNPIFFVSTGGTKRQAVGACDSALRSQAATVHTAAVFCPHQSLCLHNTQLGSSSHRVVSVKSGCNTLLLQDDALAVYVGFLAPVLMLCRAFLCCAAAVARGVGR
jgi:hypothetical protein